MSFFKYMNRKYPGQMLVEVVVAVGIIALVLVGVSDLISRSLSSVTFQKQRDIANKYAKDILDSYKKDRDLDPTTFFTNFIPGENVDCNSEVGAGFTCLKTLTRVDADNVRIRVTISWEDGKTYSIYLVEGLSNYLK